LTTQVPQNLPENLPVDIEVVVSGIDVPEGPAWGPDGSLYFVSAGEGSVYRLTEGGQAVKVAYTGGRPNGLAFSSDGTLFIADAGRQAILRLDENGKVQIFADNHESRPFGGPNDLVFLPNGDLLFTDPTRTPLPDPAISPVYRVKPDGTVSMFAGDLAFPNGIDLTADGDGVFVAEMRAHRLVMFKIGADGNAIEQKLVRRFRESASPDGMAVDVDGRVFQALPGLQSLALVGSDGTLAELYYSPNWRPSNVTFGGSDLRTVYVISQPGQIGESGGSIYSFRHTVAGVDLLQQRPSVEFANRCTAPER
jgi:gluconolactonase